MNFYHMKILTEVVGRTRVVPIRIRGSVIRIQVPRRTVSVIGPTAEERLDPTRIPFFQPKCQVSEVAVLMLHLSRAFWICVPVIMGMLNLC